MPMDSRNAREDDVDNSGNRRGSITYSISSTRPGEESTPDTSRLGSNLQVVLYQPRRTPLVGGFYLSEKWTSNPKDCIGNPEGNYSCRCFQYGLGDKLSVSNDIRILDTRGSSIINKRRRAEDDSLCYTTPCKKMRKLHDQDIFRQHDSAEIYNQIWEHSFRSTSRSSHSNTRIVQQVQHPADLSTYTRGQQHTSGYVEQNKKTPLRITNSEKDVQQDSTTMGPTTAGCVRSETQQTTSELLVTSLGSGSDSDRRLSAELEDKGTILVPAMAANPTCLETSEGAEIETSGIGDPVMAEPVLVPNDPEDETHRCTNNLETEQQMVFSRMAIIHNYRVANGLDGKTIQVLNKKIRTSTQRMYDTGWIQ
jgi:hypothetical protein